MKKYFILMCSVVVIFAMTGCGNNSELEKSAAPIVTQIIKEQLNSDVECVSVEITEKVSDKLYKAKALLNNAEKIDIVIQDKGDQIYVTIPN